MAATAASTRNGIKTTAGGDHRKRHPPPDTRRSVLAAQLLAIVALAALVFPAMTPAQVVGAGPAIKVLFLGRMALLLAVAAVFLHRRGLGWTDLGLRRPRRWRMVLAIVGGLGASAALVAGLHLVLRHLGSPPANYAMFARLKGDLPEFLYWALPVTLGSAAVGEELLFRGFVRDALQRLFGTDHALALPGAIIAQAVIFGLVHVYQGWAGMATAATIGLVLGGVWLAAGRNLWAGIVTHGLLDLSSMTVFFLVGVPAPK